jgi:hypothetical protein
MGTAGFALCKVLAGFVFLDLDITAAGAAPVNTQDFSTIFEDFKNVGVN